METLVKQFKLDVAYMECAFVIAKLSNAERRKVGAIIVSSEGGIIAEGVNGTPAGFDNCCEYTEFRLGDNQYAEGENWVRRYCKLQNDGTWLTPRGNIVREQSITKKECLHAESNAILKVARSTNSTVGATIYCTLSPCFECAKLMIQAGIKRVVYSEIYPIDEHSLPAGLDLLNEARIQVDNLLLTNHNINEDDLTLQDEGRCHHDEDPWTGHQNP